MPNILITGAASGIGKAFVTAYLEEEDNVVIATGKDFPHYNTSDSSFITSTEACIALKRYMSDVHGGKTSSSGLRIIPADFTDENRVLSLARSPSVRDLDLIIHCAGVRGLVPEIPIRRGSDVAKAETMDAMTVETMQNAFEVNTVGTFLLLRALVPRLRAGGEAKVIVMGSRMGSVGQNSTGGGFAYRASKAALNAVVKSFSVDVPEVTFVVVHPGRVVSNLVGEGVVEEGAISANESVRDMLDLIGSLRREDSGKFVDRWGVNIPW